MTASIADEALAAPERSAEPPTDPVRRSGRWSRLLWLAPPLLVLVVFFGYPLVLVGLQSLTEADGQVGFGVWARVVGTPEFGGAMLRTVLLATGSTAGCLVCGVFLALAVSFAPFPGARAVSRLVDTVLAFPSFLISLAFTFIYGGTGVLSELVGAGGLADFLYSPWGVLLAEVTFYTPFVMRPAVAAFGQVPRDQLDVAASLGAKPARVLRQVLLPEVWPALASGGCLALLLTMNEFGIVLFIGAKDVITLPILVYTKGIVTFDYPAACVVAVVGVALSVALYGGYRWVFRAGGAARAAVDQG